MDVSRWWRALLTTFDRNHDRKCGRSLTLKASCIRNLFHQDRRWMENSVATFWGDWVENVAAQTCRQVTQQLLGPASWRSSSSRVARCAATVFGFCKYDGHPPPSLLTGPRPLWFFFLFPKMKLKLKGRRFELLGPASWQSSGSRVARCAATVFGFCKYDGHPPPSLLTGPCPLWFFFPIPEDEIETQGASFWHDWRDTDRSRRKRWRRWREMTSSSASYHRNPSGIAVSVPEGTTSKGMEANRNYGKW